MPGEERISAVQSNAADCTFARVVVEVDTAILPEQTQPIPVLNNIFEGLSGWGLGQDDSAPRNGVTGVPPVWWTVMGLEIPALQRRSFGS